MKCTYIILAITYTRTAQSQFLDSELSEGLRIGRKEIVT